MVADNPGKFIQIFFQNFNSRIFLELCLRTRDERTVKFSCSSSVLVLGFFFFCVLFCSVFQGRNFFHVLFCSVFWGQKSVRVLFCSMFLCNFLCSNCLVIIRNGRIRTLKILKSWTRTMTQTKISITDVIEPKWTIAKVDGPESERPVERGRSCVKVLTELRSFDEKWTIFRKQTVLLKVDGFQY